MRKLLRRFREFLHDPEYWLDIVRWKAKVRWAMRSDLLKNQPAIRRRLRKFKVKPLRLFEALVASAFTSRTEWDYDLLQVMNRGYRGKAALEEFIRPPTRIQRGSRKEA